MAVELTVPALGESITEAVVGKWHKKVGDAVTVDEPVVVLETDKVTIDVPAPAAGALAAIAHKEGDRVKIGDVLGTIAAAPRRPVPRPRRSLRLRPRPASPPRRRAARARPRAALRPGGSIGRRRPAAADHAGGAGDRRGRTGSTPARSVGAARRAG